LLLIELAAGGALDAGLLEAAASGLLRHPELSVRALASEFFPRLAADGAALPADAELLSIAGDARRGRELFVSEHAGCARCHRHDAHGSGSGGDVGPALTMIAAKYDRAALLDALLRPSAAISFGYEPWIVSTRSGDVLSGFLLADGDPVILKEATGLRRTIPAAEIASKRRSKLSLMPDNVATGLTAQEIADLIEFLAQSR
jgi:putative heme-binding domain-containing protein